MMKKQLRTLGICTTLSMASLNLCHTPVFACNYLYEAAQYDYQPDVVDKYDQLAQKSYDVITPLLNQDDFVEKTNWIGRKTKDKGPHYFICFNYAILKSQEQDVLKALNQIDKKRPIKLAVVLKALNGYHNYTNKINLSNIKQSSMILDSTPTKKTMLPKKDRDTIFFKDILKNKAYTEDLTLASRTHKESIEQTAELSITHSCHADTKLTLNQNLSASVPLIGSYGGKVSFDLGAGYGYENLKKNVHHSAVSFVLPSNSYLVPRRSAKVLTYRLSTPDYSSIYKGTITFSGSYKDTVNRYPTWVTLNIYNKFKLISQVNPTVWAKLQSLGFGLDDDHRTVIFHGQASLDEKVGTAKDYEISIQTYRLNDDNTINYNQPLGLPKTKIIHS